MKSFLFSQISSHSSSLQRAPDPPDPPNPPDPQDPPDLPDPALNGWTRKPRINSIDKSLVAQLLDQKLMRNLLLIQQIYYQHYFTTTQSFTLPIDRAQKLTIRTTTLVSLIKGTKNAKYSKSSNLQTSTFVYFSPVYPLLLGPREAWNCFLILDLSIIVYSNNIY